LTAPTDQTRLQAAIIRPRKTGTKAAINKAWPGLPPRPATTLLSLYGGIPCPLFLSPLIFL